jgi:hypothetical protein
MFQYRIPLTGLSNASWRTAFKQPPASLVTSSFHPDRVTVRGRYLLLDTSEGRLDAWVKRIQKWIDWANEQAGPAALGPGGRKSERGTGAGRARRR